MVFNKVINALPYCPAKKGKTVAA